MGRLSNMVCKDNADGAAEPGVGSGDGKDKDVDACKGRPSAASTRAESSGHSGSDSDDDEDDEDFESNHDSNNSSDSNDSTDSTDSTEASADEAGADEASADEASADEASADEASADEASVNEASAADEATADEACDQSERAVENQQDSGPTTADTESCSSDSRRTLALGEDGSSSEDSSSSREKFRSPIYGNSGPDIPEAHQIIWGLIQDFSLDYPEIVGFLG